MDLTQSIEDFCSMLQPGDVIVFDTLSDISALVQFADNAPANHTSLMLDARTSVEANLPHADEKPIHTFDLAAVLGRQNRRGAVALRHEALVDDPSKGQAVVARINAYLTADSVFSVNDMLLLAPVALLRSYPDPQLLPPWVKKALFAALRRAAEWASPRVPRGSRRMFCSELVYRCLDEAGLAPIILDPLQDPRRRGLAGDVTPELQDYIELLDACVPLPETPSPARGSEEVLPEFVTPGDFWRSPTLVPIVSFHKPPDR